MEYCSICQDKLKCGKITCPVVVKYFSKKVILKKDFFGKSPNIFVGRFNYPEIKVGLLSAEDYFENDNPLLWKEKNFSIGQIINLRCSLINANYYTNVKNFDSKFKEISQEVALAYKPVELEINLNKTPSAGITVRRELLPFGPSVTMIQSKITENPKIPLKVEKLVNDEVKTEESLAQLFEQGFDEHYLTKILSAGLLGQNKKLVPTRWSITATDQILSNNFIKQIKEFGVFDYQLYFGSYLGNYYLIMFMPEIWSYELFEMYVKKYDCSTDFEFYNGRTTYASNCVGGYYSVRLAVNEFLKRIKKQASVLVLRFITDEYEAPLGVWVTREASRNSLLSKPIKFNSKVEMLNYAKLFVKNKFDYDIDFVLKKSQLLKYYNSQRKLNDFS